MVEKLYLPYPDSLPKEMPASGRIVSVYSRFDTTETKRRGRAPFQFGTVNFAIDDPIEREYRGTHVNIPLGSVLWRVTNQGEPINGKMVFLATGIDSETMRRIKNKIGLNGEIAKILKALDSRIAFLASTNRGNHIEFPTEGDRFRFVGRYELNNQQRRRGNRGYINRRNH